MKTSIELLANLTDEQREELLVLLQGAGDAMADTLEQLLKGNWMDDHGHPVGKNQCMYSMAWSLKGLIKFRSDYLGYEVTPASEPPKAGGMPTPLPKAIEKARSHLRGHFHLQTYDGFGLDTQIRIAEWAGDLVLDVATSTQEKSLLFGEPGENTVLTSAIYANALLMLIRYHKVMARYLTPDPFKEPANGGDQP